MCGFVGFTGLREQREAILHRMADRIIHRGPDMEGYHISGDDPRTAIALGFRRLSIIDLAAGKQPMYNEDGTVVCVFNGEIYNFMDLRTELQAKGHIFKTHCDTEVIIHGYEEYGVDLLSKVRGMFAFVIYDMKKDLVFAANCAGCAFVGRPLVEGTRTLSNYTIVSNNLGTDLMGAYRESAAGLVKEVLGTDCVRKKCPKVLVLHASSHKTSNTYAIWNRVKEQLPEMEIREIGLRNGTLSDCAGCPYKMCLHFGERGKCFYGGPIVESVYPGIQWADGILLLCPNYNDALSANLTAFINRLTALFRTTRFYDKALFAIIVSGYSGSDLIAGQLITALNMNKTFYLPGNFCIMETGNSPGSAMKRDGIGDRIQAFADTILETMRDGESRKER